MPSRVLRAFQLGTSVAQVLPAPVTDAVARLAGAAVAPLAGDRRRQVERNLRRVHGPDFGGLAMHKAVADTFASYGQYYGESFRLPGTSPAALDAGIVVDGFERIVAAREAGTGCILALPHMGAWEWAGFWVATVKHVPITVVVEALEPVDLYEWFVELRESLGMHVVPLGPDVAKHVMAALRANHVLCLLSDRDLGGGGVEVEFFGERTTLPAGPATLGIRTGAPVFPTAAFHQGRGRKGIVGPPLDCSRQGKLRDDVQRITQDLAHRLEDLIRLAPDQWHLLQPNWPSDPAASS